MADTLEQIQKLSPKLREKFCKAYIKIKLWQRKILGWDEVHKELRGLDTIREMETLEHIQKLPPEIREEICKEFIKIKLRERKDLGWEGVNAAIKKAPLCNRSEQIAMVLFCYKCIGICGRNSLCNLCHRNGRKHYLGYPIYDEDDYDEVFKKSY